MHGHLNVKFPALPCLQQTNIVHILNQINPPHAPSDFLKIHFNITLPSMSTSYKWSLYLRSPPPKPCLHLSSPPYVLHAPPTSFFLI